MLSKEEAKYIAHLSRIHLEDDEVEHLTKDLTGILKYIDKLKELNVDKVKPTSHVLPLKNVFRKDEIRPSLKQKDAMQIAVDKHEGSFKVPQVID